MDKRFEQVLKKRGNPNGHKHMKIYLTTPIIKEMKIKSIMRKKITYNLWKSLALSRSYSIYAYSITILLLEKDIREIFACVHLKTCTRLLIAAQTDKL